MRIKSVMAIETTARRRYYNTTLILPMSRLGHYYATQRLTTYSLLVYIKTTRMNM
jgi:hypothetical protein